jgi:hypothetical protein
MMQRRAVIAAFGSAIATSFVPVSLLASTKRSQRELYSNVLGNQLKLKNPSGEVTTARLVSVDEGPTCPGLEQFSIAFEGEHLTEGLFDVGHPDLVRSQIALFRCGPPDSGRNRYRAYISTFT